MSSVSPAALSALQDREVAADEVAVEPFLVAAYYGLAEERRVMLGRQVCAAQRGLLGWPRGVAHVPGDYNPRLRYEANGSVFEPGNCNLVWLDCLKGEPLPSIRRQRAPLLRRVRVGPKVGIR